MRTSNIIHIIRNVSPSVFDRLFRLFSALVGLSFGLLWGAGVTLVYRAAGPAPAAAALAVFYAFVLLASAGRGRCGCRGACV